MKKLLFALSIFTVGISMQAMAACGFASVTVDGCCVTFEVIENGYNYEVNVDGTIYTSSGEHCFSDNGDYSLVLTYFKNGVARCGATHYIQITDCENECCSPPDLDDITVTSIPNSTPPLYEVCVESECPDDTEYRFRCREVTDPPSPWMDTYYITSDCVQEQFDDCKTYEIQVGYWTSECGLTDLSESYFYTAPGDCDESCEEMCNLDAQITTYTTKDPCVRVFAYDYSINPPCCILDGIWSVSGGQIVRNLENSIEVQFSEHGMYQVCVELVVHDGDGLCDPVEICEDILITCQCKGGGKGDDCYHAPSDGQQSGPLRVHQGMSSFDTNVYPNPASQYVTFEIGALEDANAQISLMNSRGQVIRNYTQTLNVGTTYFEINDLNTLPDGIYFYHIQADNNIKTGKITLFK